MKAISRLVPAFIAIIFSSLSGAQDAFPSKTIQLIAGGAPGGTADLIARIIASAMQKEWGQPAVVVNRVAAAGTAAALAVVKAPPDGHTLLMGAGSHTIRPALQANLPYDTLRDFTAITQVTTAPNMLVVRVDFPAKNVREFIAAAKAKPGAVSYGTSGVGSTVHLGAELFSSITGIKLNHIPYGGSSQSITAVAAGQIDSSWSAVSAALPLIQSGKARPLAVASEVRSAFVPDVPTFAEEGIKDYKSDTWYGILGPANLPAPIAQKLNTFLMNLTVSAREQFLRSGAEPMGVPLEQFAEQLRKEVAAYAAIARYANIKPQ